MCEEGACVGHPPGAGVGGGGALLLLLLPPLRRREEGMVERGG